MKRFLTFLLVLAAVIFAAATIFNGESRFYITPEGWSNLWQLITGQ